MTAPDSKRPGEAALIASAPVLFVLLWGSGFPITKLGLEYIEPFTLLAIRSGLNVAVVLAILPFFRIRWPRSWREAGHIAVSGFLLQFAYSAMAPATGGGVAYWAHIGGFVAGLILIVPFRDKAFRLLGGPQTNPHRRSGGGAPRGHRGRTPWGSARRGRKGPWE